MDGMEPGVIALWAAPRSRSTAFFRYMAEHGGVIALHEPFCNLVDFGETTVQGRVIRSEAALLDTIRELARERVVFVKDTTDQRYAGMLADGEFLRTARHTFLIRRPAEVTNSFYALKPDMRISDVGIEHQCEIEDLAQAAGGRTAAIIDAADLVADPVGIIEAYCRAVRIPFRPEALNWTSGERPEWSRSGRWHTAVASSTGFHDRGTAYRHTTDTDPRLAAFSAHHEPFYRRLSERRLVAG
jgi:hypothetical protein